MIPDNTEDKEKTVKGQKTQMINRVTQQRDKRVRKKNYRVRRETT